MLLIKLLLSPNARPHALFKMYRSRENLINLRSISLLHHYASQHLLLQPQHLMLPPCHQLRGLIHQRPVFNFPTYALPEGTHSIWIDYIRYQLLPVR